MTVTGNVGGTVQEATTIHCSAHASAARNDKNKNTKLFLFIKESFLIVDLTLGSTKGLQYHFVL